MKLSTNSPKQTDGQASSPDKGWDKSLFRGDLAVETVELAAPVISFDY
jgi:hypothetical protein